MKKAFKILKDLGRSSAELSIVLTDDEEMRKLNIRYLDLNHTTDVLAFSQSEGEGGPVGVGPDILGDVVISLEQADRQASEEGVSLDSEICRLLAHGVLHLLGYDHEGSDEDAVTMGRIEDRYAGGGFKDRKRFGNRKLSLPG